MHARQFTAYRLLFFSAPKLKTLNKLKLNDVVVVVILLQVRHHDSCSPEALSVTGKIEA
jgi:hypothetical protein